MEDITFPSSRIEPSREHEEATAPGKLTYQRPLESRIFP